MKRNLSRFIVFMIVLSILLSSCSANETIDETGANTITITPSYTQGQEEDQTDKTPVTDDITDNKRTEAPYMTETPDTDFVTPTPTNPVATAKPVMTTKPVTTATPVPTTKPVATATPVPTTKPVTTATPVPTTKPVTTATPVPTAKPVATTQPTTTEPFIFPELVIDPELDDRDKANLLFSFSRAKLMTDNFELDLVLNGAPSSLISTVIPDVNLSAMYNHRVIKYTTTDAYDVSFDIKDLDSEGNTIISAICKDGYLYVSDTADGVPINKKGEYDIDIVLVLKEMLEDMGQTLENGETTVTGDGTMISEIPGGINSTEHTDIFGMLGALTELDLFTTVIVTKLEDGGYTITYSNVDAEKVNAYLLEVINNTDLSASDSAETINTIVALINRGSMRYSGSLTVTIDENNALSHIDFDLAISVVALIFPVPIMNFSVDANVTNYGGEFEIVLPENASSYQEVTEDEVAGLLTDILTNFFSS